MDEGEGQFFSTCGNMRKKEGGGKKKEKKEEKKEKERRKIMKRWAALQRLLHVQNSLKTVRVIEAKKEKNPGGEIAKINSHF